MALTADQVREFREQGVLVAEGVLTDADLAPVIDEYSGWVDRRARELAAEGKVTELHEDAPFERRFALLYAQSQEMSVGLDIMLARGPAIFAFLHNERLLDAVESIIGPELTCSPIQHVRAKPPVLPSGGDSKFYIVPWHQDAGVTWWEADDSDILTCWIAVTDATVENGCMEVMPGAWKGGYLEHQAEGGTTIKPHLRPEIPPRAVPVKKGGVIFMHRYTPHRSTPNFTRDQVRWSIDLRYQPTGQPTGRPFQPAFVARSRRDPSSVLTDHAEWSRLWAEALETSKGIKAHRVE